MSQGRVLLVDDDEGILDVVAYALSNAGFEVVKARLGAEALRIIEQGFDIVVLDVMLPDMSGNDVCQQIRTGSPVPIVMLTAKDTEVDRVLGLEFGADDYVGKPFSVAELIGRIRAILRRRQLDLEEAGGAIRSVGRLRIDLSGHEVFVDDRRVTLTQSEFRILTLLAEQPGRVFTREQIMNRLWRVPFAGAGRACDGHIFNLRRKLEFEPGSPHLLITVRGVGYKLGDWLVRSE